MPASSVSTAAAKARTTTNNKRLVATKTTLSKKSGARTSIETTRSAVEITLSEEILLPEETMASSMAALFVATSIDLDVEPEVVEPEEVAAEVVKAGAMKAAKKSLAVKQARRDEVVLEHLPLVKAIALRVHENLPVHVDLDDLVHAGILGLFDAVAKFNPDKMVTFSSYAKHRIKGAILDSLRQLDWASRDLRRRHKQVEQATRELTSTLQRAPSEAELAGKLGVDVERWRQMAIDLRNVGLISASTRANESEDLPAPEFPSKPELQPDRICAHEQMRDMLSLAMKTLPERYQKVVFLYYSNEMTMKEIGNVLGINESRVSQIHKTALEKMSTALQEAGITSAYAFQ